MNRQSDAVLSAVTVVLVLSAASLLLWDQQAALWCVPLLLMAWALRRGKVWAAFGLLGHGTALLVLCWAGLIGWQASVAAGLALACFGLLLPLLWRADRLATVVAAVAVLGLGTGGAAWVTLPPATAPLPRDLFKRADRPVGGLSILPLEGGFGRRVAPRRFTLELLLVRSPEPGTGRWLRLLVTNNSRLAVGFAHPMEGSVRCGLRPGYQVTARDLDGHELAPVLGAEPCQGHLLERQITLVKPGETFSVAFALPRCEGQPARVRVTYAFDPEQLDDRVQWWATASMRRRLGSLFAGSLSSPWIALDPASEVTAPSPLVRGALDKEIIRRLTRSHLDRVWACFYSGGPARLLAGLVKVRYIIAAHGRVQNARVTASTIQHPLVESCLVREVSKWRFPSCKCGGIVLVEQPFEKVVAVYPPGRSPGRV